MPISSFYGLQTSLRGLLAQQRSLDTTAHNIANASTAGYSRQEAVLAAATATDIPAGMLQNGGGAQLGAGVDVLAYQRVRDNFLDLQYRGQATTLGREKARSQGLDRAELSLAEPSDNGISKRLSEFWDAWETLAHAPDEPAGQQSLLSKAAALTDAIKTVSDQFETVKNDAETEYDQLLATGGEIYNTAKDIADLNKTIKAFVTAGDTPNDLLDKRDGLLDKLAGYGRVRVDAKDDGTIDVYFGNVKSPSPPLVSGVEEPTWSPPGWTPPSPPTAWESLDDGPGGRLGGLLGLFKDGGTIDDLVNNADYGLNGVAGKLVAGVNTALGASFLVATGGDEAATMQLAPGAAAALQSLGSAGAASSAVLDKVAALRDGTIDDAYQTLVASVGNAVADADRRTANAQVLTDSVDDRRQSVSGVALDEEMSNLVRFQRAYQASARAMSTMDEMLDVLINRTGRVGL